ncbi:Pre-mRNA-processing factor 19 [Armadillidium vulgare]|nr:Pre-mRNA-processing factor 19 [Armadillidium vulgare]
MSLICALSNEVPEQPVVSPVSGAIFERRLIEKYIAECNVDPISNKELTVEQLIDLKVPTLTKPKPASGTSIPAILKSLQDEWDAVMLHSFSLRQQLHTARQELRYLRSAATAEAGGAADVPAEGAGLSEDVVSKLQETATVLTQERKRRGRTAPEGLTHSETIRSFSTLASHPGLHSASVPGILALDVHQKDTSKMVTGGADKNATVFNKDTEQVVAILKGHNKKVTCVVYHPTEDTVITASPDTQIRVWNVDTSQTLQLIRAHDAPVTGLSLHATGDYILSSSLDHNWAFSDIRVGRVLCKVSDQSASSPLTAAQFHPDGLILGTGTQDAAIKIWDLKERSNVANFPGHSGAISSIAFSENGYYLATAAEDSTVRLWDLRKLRNFKTIQLDEGYEVNDLCFDQSGTYLAVAGTDVRVYLCKQWTSLREFNDHTAQATGVRFGTNAEFLASTSMDRTLKIYGS